MKYNGLYFYLLLIFNKAASNFWIDKKTQNINRKKSFICFHGGRKGGVRFGVFKLEDVELNSRVIESIDKEDSDDIRRMRSDALKLWFCSSHQSRVSVALGGGGGSGASNAPPVRVGRLRSEAPESLETMSSVSSRRRFAEVKGRRGRPGSRSDEWQALLNKLD